MPRFIEVRVSPSVGEPRVPILINVDTIVACTVSPSGDTVMVLKDSIPMRELHRSGNVFTLTDQSYGEVKAVLMGDTAHRS